MMLEIFLQAQPNVQPDYGPMYFAGAVGGFTTAAVTAIAAVYNIRKNKLEIEKLIREIDEKQQAKQETEDEERLVLTPQEYLIEQTKKRLVGIRDRPILTKQGRVFVLIFLIMVPALFIFSPFTISRVSPHLTDPPITPIPVTPIPIAYRIESGTLLEDALLQMQRFYNDEWLIRVDDECYRIWSMRLEYRLDLRKYEARPDALRALLERSEHLPERPWTIREDKKHMLIAIGCPAKTSPSVKPRK
jgi:hypothetical protein